MLLKPSITFNGQAEEAIKFYQTVFKGEIVNLSRFSDAKGNPQVEKLDEKYKNRLLNARLDFGDNKFNVCDCFPGVELVNGNNVQIDLVFYDDKDIHETYNALAEGGTATMPLTKTFFSPNFGNLTDKFGIHWSIMQMPPQ